MMSRRFRLYLGLLLLTLSSPSWGQIIHWEVNAVLTAPGTSADQERSFSGGFDFNTLSREIFNVAIISTSTTGTVCFLCFDYTDASPETFRDGTGFYGVGLTKRVDGESGAYRQNFLGMFDFDVSQPRTFSEVRLEEYSYFNAGTGDPVDDTFIADSCAECGTLIGTIAPIPEPETCAMLLTGLGLLGLNSRRKTRTMVSPAVG